MDGFVAIAQDVGEGHERRRWVDLLARGPRGALWRIVARTPLIYGEGEDADLRSRRAVAEAELMRDGLKKRMRGGAP